jgi:hypothetical protein
MNVEQSLGTSAPSVQVSELQGYTCSKNVQPASHNDTQFFKTDGCQPCYAKSAVLSVFRTTRQFMITNVCT